MNVAEVTALFRWYVDEEDGTFVDPGTAAYLLKMGYNEFRKFVNDADNMAYAIYANFSMAAQMTYDLGGTVSATRILGPTPTQERLQRLITLCKMNSDGTIQQVYTAAGNLAELRRVGYGAGDGYMQGVGPFFLLRNTTLEFGTPTTGPFQLAYTPISKVDWTKTAALDLEFIDNFDDFHDLIALFALRQYEVANGGNNVVGFNLLEVRKTEFADFLAYGRNPVGNNHVVRDY